MEENVRGNDLRFFGFKFEQLAFVECVAYIMQHIAEIRLTAVVVIGVKLFLLQAVHMLVRNQSGSEHECVDGSPFLPGFFDVVDLFVCQTQSRSEQKNRIIVFQRRRLFGCYFVNLYQTAVC